MEPFNTVNSGVYVLDIVKSLFENNSLRRNNCNASIRKSLSHFILHNANKMTGLYLICGHKDDTPEDDMNDTVNWIECEKCYRWSHNTCFHSIKFDTFFKCLICDEN